METRPGTFRERPFQTAGTSLLSTAVQDEMQASEKAADVLLVPVPASVGARSRLGVPLPHTRAEHLFGPSACCHGPNRCSVPARRGLLFGRPPECHGQGHAKARWSHPAQHFPCLTPRKYTPTPTTTGQSSPPRIPSCGSSPLLVTALSLTLSFASCCHWVHCSLSLF